MLHSDWQSYRSRLEDVHKLSQRFFFVSSMFRRENKNNRVVMQAYPSLLNSWPDSSEEAITATLFHPKCFINAAMPMSCGKSAGVMRKTYSLLQGLSKELRPLTWMATWGTWSCSHSLCVASNSRKFLGPIIAMAPLWTKSMAAIIIQKHETTDTLSVLVVVQSPSVNEHSEGDWKINSFLIQNFVFLKPGGFWI